MRKLTGSAGGTGFRSKGARFKIGTAAARSGFLPKRAESGEGVGNCSPAPLRRDDDARLELALASMLEGDQLTHEIGDVGPELGEAGELALTWRTRPLGVYEAGKRLPSGVIELRQQY